MGQLEAASFKFRALVQARAEAEAAAAAAESEQPDAATAAAEPMSLQQAMQQHDQNCLEIGGIPMTDSSSTELGARALKLSSTARLDRASRLRALETELAESTESASFERLKHKFYELYMRGYHEGLEEGLKLGRAAGLELGRAVGVGR